MYRIQLSHIDYIDFRDHSGRDILTRLTRWQNISQNIDGIFIYTLYNIYHMSKMMYLI